MKDVLVFLIHSYTVRHLRVDEDIQLEDFVAKAKIQGYVVASPTFLVLKTDKVLSQSKDGIFVAFELPRG